MIIRSSVAFLLAVLLSFFTASLRADPVVMNWKIDGKKRVALIYPPTLPSARAGVPVIFAFHGHGSGMRNAAKTMAFQNLWPQALVVYMQGAPTKILRVDPFGLFSGWQLEPGDYGDRDLKFFDAVLATLREKYPVNRRRIYSTGFSNGGYFTYLLWELRGNVFAAYAPCAGAILSDAHLGAPRPDLHIAGLKDHIVPFKEQYATIRQVLRNNHCSQEAKPPGIGRTLYPSSIGAPVVTLVHPGGHLFPKQASAAIVDFFKSHARSP